MTSRVMPGGSVTWTAGKLGAHRSWNTASPALRTARLCISKVTCPRGVHQDHSVQCTVPFPFDEPLPHDLIDRIVRFRVQDNIEERA